MIEKKAIASSEKSRICIVHRNTTMGNCFQIFPVLDFKMNVRGCIDGIILKKKQGLNYNSVKLKQFKSWLKQTLTQTNFDSNKLNIYIYIWILLILLNICHTHTHTHAHAHPLTQKIKTCNNPPLHELRDGKNCGKKLSCLLWFELTSACFHISIIYSFFPTRHKIGIGHLGRFETCRCLYSCLSSRYHETLSKKISR